MAVTTSPSSILLFSRSRLITWPITWTIDNMSHRGNTVTSPSFKYASNDSFVLELGIPPGREDHLSLTINSTAFTCNASVKLYIIMAGNEKKCLYESPKNVIWPIVPFSPYIKYKLSFTIHQIISYAELYDPTNGYLYNDHLTIMVELGFLVNDTNVQSTFGEPFEPMKSIVNFQTREAFGRLLATGKLADVTLTVDGKIIPAHKAILAIRSPVLAAMFEGDTREALENRVEITDVKVDVFEQMLNFIYTGAMPLLDQQTAEELLIAADKYQVDGLKAICENYLCSQLSPETAPNLFLFAEAINAPMLMDCAVKFINSRAPEVFRAMTSESDQLLEMIRFLAAKNEEKDATAAGKRTRT